MMKKFQGICAKFEIQCETFTAYRQKDSEVKASYKEIVDKKIEDLGESSYWGLKIVDEFKRNYDYSRVRNVRNISEI